MIIQLSTPQDEVLSTPGLFAYWTAENTITNAAGTAFVSLPDSSGNGIAARNMAAVSTVPTFNRADVNFGYRPSISGTAINVRVQSTFDVTLPQPSTVYHVLRCVTPAATMYWRSQNGNFATSAGLWLSTGRVPTMQTADGGGAFSGAALTANTNYVNCSIYNGASSAMYFNNSQTAFASGNADVQGCIMMTVGNFSSAVTYSWASLAMFAGAHDGPTRYRIMSYLGSKFRIAVT